MGSTFLTQFGVDNYDGLEKYTVSGTSQSTVLLQKKKKMKEVQQELDRKKLEYEQRMRKCKEKEQDLAEKQEKIRESVIRFEKFVKENDAKRTRAMKREKDEISSRMQKELEIAALTQTLTEHTRLRHRLLRMVEKLSVYEAYLESVLEPSDEFEEVAQLTKRHDTLTHTNQDLRSIVEKGNEDIEEMRATLSLFTKEKENEILVATSNIAGHQKRADQMRNDNSKVEQELMFRDNAYNDRKRRLGECKMAIANIYQRCKKGNVPYENMNDFGRLLDYIQNRMLDLGAICRMQKEAHEW
eukprot:CAMPEP_0114264436 /NCGR_PEP_ID=MMETSP0058-20121206/23203_1 /TAXON_ID=36894 /ORGANISM="Pyramimonas parkeae, CCMP726" /LENGTH=298 /DNA_ID=CAMNT_0001381105 /DNA_START=310 /DNA_END=1203 /DNA_ORIENTATION=+